MGSLLPTDDFVSVYLRGDDDSSILPDPSNIHIHIPKERKIHIKFPDIAHEAEDSRPKAIDEQPKVATSPPKVMTFLTTEKPAEIGGVPEVVTTLPRVDYTNPKINTAAVSKVPNLTKMPSSKSKFQNVTESLTAAEEAKIPNTMNITAAIVESPEFATASPQVVIAAAESTPPPTTIPPLSTTSSPTICRTVRGPDSGYPCVFPFRFEGVLHKECTFVGNYPGETEPWCSTLTNSNDDHVGGQGNWGFCASDCPVASESSLPNLKQNPVEIVMSPEVATPSPEVATAAEENKAASPKVVISSKSKKPATTVKYPEDDYAMPQVATEDGNAIPQVATAGEESMYVME